MQSTEEKIIAFHQCTIIVDLIIPFLRKENDFSTYLIRTISYMLIHLISNDCQSDSVVNLICCRYFHTFLFKVLPENTELMEVFMVPFVSILIPIAKCNTRVSDECTKLLKLLIVEYADDLSKAIELLDPFPQEEKFVEMRDVYDRVRQGKVYKLEDVISRFLKTSILMGSTGNRIEGLKHLKIELSTKKFELKELYGRLQDLRGFSEDCEKSILHQLICVLVKLSLSADTNVGSICGFC